MKLITEESQDIQYLVEEDKKTGKKSHYVQGIFLQAEIKNRNGRIYPRHVLQREVDRYNREAIATNRSLGELGHPENPSVNLDRVSHMITKLYPDGNNFIGKAKILDTPNGKIAQALLEGGASLGVSSRGVGSLRECNGVKMVCEDYHLSVAADLVSEPSAHEAYVQGIMENMDWWLDNAGEWRHRQLEHHRKLVREASKSELEAVALRVFENFIGKYK